MFGLTLLAAGITSFFAVMDYLIYFVFRLTAVQRFALGLVMFGGFFLLMKTHAEEVFLPLARAIKDDMANESRVESVIDFWGFMAVLFVGYVIHWVMYARASGKSDTYGLVTGTLLGAFMLA